MSAGRVDGGAAEGYAQDAIGWPTKAECGNATTYNAELAKAKLEVRKKRAEAEIEHAKALYQSDIDLQEGRAEAEQDLRKTYYQSVFEVAKGSIDRARAGAELVQKAASAIVTLYTALVAVTFSVSDNPLPWRGVLPAFFLGLAIVLSSGFLAYLPEWRSDEEDGEEEVRSRAGPLSEGTSDDLFTTRLGRRLSLGLRTLFRKKRSEEEENAEDRHDGQGASAKVSRADHLATLYILWSRRAATQRSWWLRASVISLAVALCFLPAGFIGGGQVKDRGEVAVSSQLDWPTLTENAPRDLKLQEIVYSAQVAEAAEKRKEWRLTAPETEEYHWLWAAFAAAGLCVVFVVPTIYPREPRSGSGLPQPTAVR